MRVRDRSALQQLDGYSFPVLHGVGARPRAEQIAARLERAHRYLAEVLTFDPTVRLLILPPQDWSAHAAFPLYGMPHIAGRDTIVVGDAPARFWQGVVRLLDGVLSPAQRAEIEVTYGTVGGTLDLAPFADLLVVHELGHLFHAQVPFAFPRRWLMELFANLCVHAYLTAREPDQVPRWTLLPERMLALPAERVRHRSLADFERLSGDVGPENYCWYQFQLAVACRALVAAAGPGALRQLYQTFAAHEREYTDRQLAKLLTDHTHPTAAAIMATWPRDSRSEMTAAPTVM